MVIPEEQPAQPALPIQPEGMRVVCGHCGNTFLVRKTHQDNQLNQSQACSCRIVLLCCCWYVHANNLESQIAVYSSVFFFFCCNNILGGIAWCNVHKTGISSLYSCQFQAHIRVLLLKHFLSAEMKTFILLQIWSEYDVCKRLASFLLLENSSWTVRWPHLVTRNATYLSNLQMHQLAAE